MLTAHILLYFATLAPTTPCVLSDFRGRLSGLRQEDRDDRDAPSLKYVPCQYPPLQAWSCYEEDHREGRE